MIREQEQDRAWQEGEVERFELAQRQAIEAHDEQARQMIEDAWQHPGGPLW